MLLQLLFVLAAIIVGARLGGIGLGVMGGVGLAILTIRTRNISGEIFLKKRST